MEFLQVVIGGIVLGLILGWIIQNFSRRFLEPVVGVLFSFTIPYITYALALYFDVSGVLAVVVVGLIGSRVLLTHHSSLRRILGFATWDIFVIALNCFVFMLIGLHLRTFAPIMTAEKMWLYSWYALLFTIAMVLVRMCWVYSKSAIAYVKALYQPQASVICPEILHDAAIIGWSGMRGIVSLTAALAIPLTLPRGLPLEGREEVIFITFIVILITLLIPGLTLPFLIKWLDLKNEEEEENVGRVSKVLSKIADDQISRLHDREALNDEEFGFLKTYFKLQRRLLGNSSHTGKFRNIELARHKVIQEQKKYLVGMWKRHEIGDKLFSEIEQQLDVEETHKARADLH